MNNFNNYEALEWAYEILRGALEDILSADETSTLEGALAIAKAALERVGA